MVTGCKISLKPAPNYGISVYLTLARSIATRALITRILPSYKIASLERQAKEDAPAECFLLEQSAL